MRVWGCDNMKIQVRQATNRERDEGGRVQNKTTEAVSETTTKMTERKTNDGM